MKLSDYLKKKEENLRVQKVARVYCSRCGFAQNVCYCSQIKSFDPKITFVILIHQMEIDRKIATGRLSHLILENSLLIPGHDYSHDKKVNELLADPQYFPVVLFPGDKSIEYFPMVTGRKKSFLPLHKKLLIFVVDGIWATARQTMRLSQNLANLPRISFDLNSPSRFRVRKQPREGFCSTVEAIHQTIELLGDISGYKVKSCAHDNLLEVFDFMVEKQLSFYGE